jgi:hypothetical protein
MRGRRTFRRAKSSRCPQQFFNGDKNQCIADGGDWAILADGWLLLLLVLLLENNFIDYNNKILKKMIFLCVELLSRQPLSVLRPVMANVGKNTGQVNDKEWDECF